MSYLFIDGSETKTSAWTYDHGYGYCGYLDGSYVEGFGKTPVDKAKVGSHELHAFLISWQEIHSRYDFETLMKTNFYVDDFVVAFGMFAHMAKIPGSPYIAAAGKFLGMYPELVCPNLITAVTKGPRIYKVKGHSGIVLQERANYLANQARNNKDFLGFNEWLKVGISQWNNDSKEMEIVQLPFV